MLGVQQDYFICQYLTIHLREFTLTANIPIVQTAVDASVAADVGAGWYGMMDRLAIFLDTREFAPEDNSQWKMLYADYRATDQA